MENIESTIVELGSVFQELAHMVKEQEEQIERSGAWLHQFFIPFKTALIVVKAGFCFDYHLK